MTSTRLYFCLTAVVWCADSLRVHVFNLVVPHPCTLRVSLVRLQSPGTGLYSQLAKYNLPAPEAVFDIDFFRANPKPFNMLAKELFPGQYAPTPAHHFIKVLADRGWLLRCYTQNIDGLERVAGVDPGTVCVCVCACACGVSVMLRPCFMILYLASQSVTL